MDENFEQEGDYQEGDVDQEGMDIEYFSQYKVRAPNHKTKLFSILCQVNVTFYKYYPPTRREKSLMEEQECSRYRIILLVLQVVMKIGIGQYPIRT